MATQLTADRRDGVRQEVVPGVGVEAAGGLGEADEGHLVEVVEVDAAARVAAGDRVCDDDVGLDQLVHQPQALLVPGPVAHLATTEAVRRARASRSLARRRSPRCAGTGGVVRVATSCSFRAMGPCCRRPRLWACTDRRRGGRRSDSRNAKRWTNHGQVVVRPGIGAGQRRVPAARFGPWHAASTSPPSRASPASPPSRSGCSTRCRAGWSGSAVFRPIVRSDARRHAASATTSSTC